MTKTELQNYVLNLTNKKVREIGNTEISSDESNIKYLMLMDYLASKVNEVKGTSMTPIDMEQYLKDFESLDSLYEQIQTLLNQSDITEHVQNLEMDEDLSKFELVD